VNSVGSQIPDETHFEAGTVSPEKERSSALTVHALRGIVPAIPGQTSGDFENQIEDAMEEEAARIIDQMQALWSCSTPATF
jgi:hypothetical protein